MIVLLVLLLVLTGLDGDGAPGTLPPASFEPNMRYRLLVDKNCIPNDCDEATPGPHCNAWSLDFRQSLVNALNDEMDGIQAVHTSDPASPGYLVDLADVHVAK